MVTLYYKRNRNIQVTAEAVGYNETFWSVLDKMPDLTGEWDAKTILALPKEDWEVTGTKPPKYRVLVNTKYYKYYLSSTLRDARKISKMYGNTKIEKI